MRPAIAHILGGREMGGIATVVFSLLEEQSRAGSPILLTLDDSTIAEMARQKGYRADVFPAGPLTAPIALCRVVRLLQREHVALIHTHSVLAHIFGYFIKKWMKRVSFLMHVHASIQRELVSQETTFLKRAIYTRAISASLRACDALIANSDAVRRDLAEQGVDIEKITVVHNGVDVERIRLAAGASKLPASLREGFGQNRIIGTLGRFTPIKNQKLMLLAARTVVKQHPDVLFLLVGDGKERGRLEQMGRELGLEDKLIFTGWLDSPYPVLSRMDILVLPSLWEGLGVTILEAMALGKPVVATKVGGIPEVVSDGETGLLVPSGDEEALASALHKLLSNPELARDMGRRGKIVVEQKFPSTRTAREVEEVYESSMNGKGRLAE
ncbi:MAG: glycosyltransferase family 4 protein [Candidatus Eisenbacteria bacterium]